ELEIYNKAEESKGKNPVQTRIEFRLKRMRKNNNIDDAINAVICALESLPDCIGLLSSKKIEQLSNRYIYEQAADYEGRLTAFSSFVCKYADFIYNIDILKGLHNRFGTRSCKEWLYSYRKQGKTLTLYGKGDIIEYLTAITKSLQAYSKSSI
ncbi:MAG: hypothetical protein LIO87_11435, partial [Eubacterium sp.]|nr:hypothetical protein [Eubacterium sp.]